VQVPRHEGSLRPSQCALRMTTMQQLSLGAIDDV
jgi:hypothetical protein